MTNKTANKQNSIDYNFDRESINIQNQTIINRHKQVTLLGSCFGRRHTTRQPVGSRGLP